MEFNFATVLIFVTGLLTGLVGALKIIAPLTKTKVDDKIEEYAEKALEVLPSPAPKK